MIQVIVPVYNSQKTIRRCLDSIINQTSKDWKLFVVDDGSTDDSLLICESYALRDNRISVFTQQNSGAGQARNTGLSKITKDGYVVFVDSDDYIESIYFSLLEKHEEDLVFIDVRKIENDRKISLESISKFKHKTKDCIIRYQTTGRLPWGGVRKAVKASIVLDNQISFTKHLMGEEALYSFKVLYYSQTIGFLDKPVYNYIVHSDSLSQTYVEDPWGPVAVNLKLSAISMGVYDRYAKTINAFFCSSMVASLYRLSIMFERKRFSVKAKQRFKEFLNQLDSNYGIDYNSLGLSIKLVYFAARFRLFWLVRLLARAKHSRKKG